ncbi:MAG: hypothetical protein SF182_11670 [Deltaproteobacteria bacterium]|nr:hypothetical protein [Deltaproteobacteria bacterium]
MRQTRARSLLALAAMFCSLTIGAARAAEPAGEASSGATLEVLLDTIRANRRALIAANLNLSSDEATRFWPLYDQYQTEMNAVGDRLATIVEDYTANFRDLSNDKALQLVNGYLAAEADRIKVRETYIPKFAEVVPGRTVARFFQIENKMDAVLRYDLAKTIPVVDEKPAP